MSDNPNCFISRCPKCNALTFASVDLPERRKDNAKEVAALIRDGRTIENMPVDQVRTSKWCFNMQCETATDPQVAMFV